MFSWPIRSKRLLLPSFAHRAFSIPPIEDNKMPQSIRNSITIFLYVQQNTGQHYGDLDEKKGDHCCFWVSIVAIATRTTPRTEVSPPLTEPEPDSSVFSAPVSSPSAEAEAEESAEAKKKGKQSLKNPSCHELNVVKKRRSNDLEALKLWEVSSGTH